MKSLGIWAGSICLAGLSAFAQMGPPPPGGGMGHMGPGGGPFGFGHHAKMVTGAPYSATVTNTVIQQLAGGNSIQRTTTGQVARDSAGRTYEQQTVTGGPFAQKGPVTITFISDPVAGYNYVLNSTAKTAMRHQLKVNASGGPNPDWHGRQPKDSSNVTESDLAPDSSSGVTAQGKSVTRTIPAGTIGNAQPITSTSQTWYSTDLQIVVKAVRNDPRFGESTYALSNVMTKEPDASLFQVPAGYTVSDAPQHGLHEGPPPPLQ